ncbi:MAG TPA: hypothetical protein VIS29_16525 [Streptomyces sp.]
MCRLDGTLCLAAAWRVRQRLGPVPDQRLRRYPTPYGIGLRDRLRALDN